MSKFKEGDWVKVINPSNWGTYRNAVGVVTFLHGDNIYRVEFPQGYASAFSESELSLASESDIERAKDYPITIFLAKLREVLNEYSKEKNLMIDDFDTDEIIDRIKQELK